MLKNSVEKGAEIVSSLGSKWFKVKIMSVSLTLCWLAQFAQQFFFNQSKLHAYRHLRDELLTTLFGRLFAVTQVDVADIAAAFEVRQW